MKTIGASRVAAAIGLDESTSRYDVYREVAFGERKPVSPFLQSLFDFGNHYELTAVAYTEATTGEMFFYTGDRQKKYKKDRFTCHPDGINPDATLEVKSRQPGSEAYSVGDKHWKKYMAQVQQAMYVCERELAYFSCWCIDGGSRIWRVQRNEKYITRMHELLAEFFEFVDGEKPCPKSLSKRPRMPSIKYEQLDGPPQPELTDDLLASLVHTKAKTLKTVRGLDKLEERMLLDHPGRSEAIARGTELRRQEINGKISSANTV